MRAFILAGGFATRLWPLTEKRAKPLLPLAGKPMLTHIVASLPPGLRVTVSTNEAFVEGFEQWKKTLDRDVDILVERTNNDDQKLGALGAVAAWVRDAHIDDDVFLLTGDNYFGCPLARIAEAYRPPHPLVAAYDIGEAAKASAFGTIVLAEDGKTIRAFEEKPAQPKTTLVSTGASVLPASTLPLLLEFAAKKPDNVGGMFEEFLSRGMTVDCVTFREPWFDVGSFEAYLDATKLLVGDSLVSQGTFEGGERRGSVVLGEGTKVTDSELENTVVFENCDIDDCVLRDCVIDSDCVLKGVDLSGKMIRAGTRLVRE